MGKFQHTGKNYEEILFSHYVFKFSNYNVETWTPDKNMFKLYKKENEVRNLNAGDGVEERQALHVINPHLWNGRLDPYLYTLKVESVLRRT